jgi:hypothetical protein
MFQPVAENALNAGFDNFIYNFSAVLLKLNAEYYVKSAYEHAPDAPPLARRCRGAGWNRHLNMI